jgi:hypothetical protein
MPEPNGALRSGPPLELLDPEGEGIYLLNDEGTSVLIRAARLFGCSWREVEHSTVYMRPDKTGDAWHEVNVGRFPYGWRFLLPRRWQPVDYAYCTPPVTG